MKKSIPQPTIPSAIPTATDAATIYQSLEHRLVYSVGKDNAMATTRDWFYATAYMTRDTIMDILQPTRTRTKRNIPISNIPRRKQNKNR